MFGWYLCSSIFTILGILFKITKPKYPVNGNNPLRSGFDLKVALKSEAHWNYAQRIGANLYIGIGIVLFAISQILYVIFEGDVVLMYYLSYIALIFMTIANLICTITIHIKTKKLNIEEGDEYHE
ncbi:MAG: SdpI family protein [Lachnospirales bacterium]